VVSTLPGIRVAIFQPSPPMAVFPRVNVPIVTSAISSAVEIFERRLRAASIALWETHAAGIAFNRHIHDAKRPPPFHRIPSSSNGVTTLRIRIGPRNRCRTCQPLLASIAANTAFRAALAMAHPFHIDTSPTRVLIQGKVRSHSEVECRGPSIWDKPRISITPIVQEMIGVQSDQNLWRSN